ncbi:MAG: PEP-CTERM sorting domain-containing protein [Gammaproteobacteria bacterium]
MHKVLPLALILGLSWGQASAVVIEDNYWGSNNRGYGDVISAPGDSSYQIHNMEVTFSGGFMNVIVNTNFTGPDKYGVDFGDLFISTNGWNPYGSAADNYKYDNYSNGEGWEFVFDTSASMLYGGDFSINLSDDMMGAGYVFRNGQEVQRRDGGTAYAGSSVDLSNAGNGGYIEYNILLSSLGITDGTDIGLKWGMTCANDTIEGVVTASVPEPTSLLLLSIGLLGLGAVTRRKRSS